MGQGGQVLACLFAFWGDGLARGLFSNLMCTKSRFWLSDGSKAPVGFSFVTSVKKDCWDWARTSKPQSTMKNTDSPRSPQAPTTGAVDLKSEQPSQSSGYHSNSGCRPPAVSRHIIPSPSRTHTHSCTWTLNCRFSWLHTCTKFTYPVSTSSLGHHVPGWSEPTVSHEQSHQEFSCCVVWHKSFFP